MNFNRLAMAVLLSVPAVATAGVTITPMYGYQTFDNIMKDDSQPQIGVGYRFANNFGIEGVLNKGTAGLVDSRGWSYNSQGKVVHIPSQDGQNFPCQHHSFTQRAFPTVEQDGLVWVYLGNKLEIERPPLFKLPFYDKQGWSSYFMVGTYEGELDAVAQNIMDVTHTIFVHNKWFRSESGKQVKAEIEVTSRSVVVTYDDTDNNVGMMPWLTNPHKAPQIHTDSFYAPNITLVEYHWGEPSGVAFNSIINPVDEFSSRVYTCVSYKLPWPRVVSSLIKPFMKMYTHIVNQQDVTILAARRKGFHQLPMIKQHSVQADMAHIAIDKILTALINNKPINPAVLGKKHMTFEI